MAKLNQLLADPDPQLHYSTAPPVRTDAGQDAAPSLKLKVQIPEPPGPKMTQPAPAALPLRRASPPCLSRPAAALRQ